MDKRPIESILPSEIMEKAREYAKTIDHSYADTREELEEDVALAWAKGFTFCLQGKVKAVFKDKEEAIQKLTNENAELKSEKGCETCTKFDEVKLTEAKGIIRALLFHLSKDTFAVIYETKEESIERAEKFLMGDKRK